MPYISSNNEGESGVNETVEQPNQQKADPKTELKVQSGIRQAEDAIVLAIQDALDNCEYPAIPNSN